MLSVDELKKECESARDASDEQCKEYESVVHLYDELGLPVMDASSDLMFSNHVMCVIKRIHTGEFVEDMPEELFSDVSEKAREASSRLLAGLFASNGREPNKTEVLMLATHIEVALQAEK